MIRYLLSALAVALIACVAGGYGILHYLTHSPGTPHSGALPPLTAEESALASLLKRHIETIAAHEHNIAHYDELQKVARYLETTLESYGYTVNRWNFFVDDKSVRNIDVVIEPPSDAASPEVIVVGAHYDSARTSPGANDNATGTAAVLELARLLGDLRGKSRKRIRLALFVNEEPPYFQTADMGSLRYAEALSSQNEPVVAMYSLETLGCYSSAPGTQRYPVPFGLLLPDRGDFISFVGTLNSRPLVHEAVRSFRSHTRFPTVAGVAPSVVPGFDWSDHWAFEQLGVQALMITDTALYRYPHYHRPSDTPDKVDVEKLARVLKGIERVIRDAAR
jgi:hypothetical protein